MAVAKLSKLLIVTHKSDEESVLKKLQSTSLVEIKPLADKIEKPLLTPIKVSDDDIKVKKALKILESYKSKEMLRVAAKAGKLVIKKNEYEEILASQQFEEIVDNILDIENEIIISESKVSEIEPRINQLDAWSSFKGNLCDIGTRDIYTIKLGIIKGTTDEFRKIVEDLSQEAASVEKVSQDGDIIYIILAYHNDGRKDVEEYLNDISFEETELTGYKGTIKENLAALKKNIEYFKNKKANLLSEINKITLDYEKCLTVYLDYLENNIEVENAINSGFSTETVSFYTAWVKKKEKEKIFLIIKKFKFTKISEIEPEEGENIPIILENKPLFRPFEIIINLYGVPRYFEIDPSMFVSLFFAVFFGLCLTDAGYGIILALLTLIFAFKMKTIKNFLMLIFIGGIFTIVAGVLFNGWFGDLPKYIGLEQFFLRFALLGDPVSSNESAMNFFRLALMLGVIHVVFGLFIKFFDSIRRRDWGGAFLDGLPWILIIVSLVIIFLSIDMAVSMNLVSAPIFPASIARILIWVILAGAIVIIFFGARSEKSWGFRIFMGFLNLTIVNGLTSYLGDFLSYIRLMALGLVTAGIAVAVNKIAFQFLSMPYIGIVLMIIILIGGHTFNIGINILGGFVHTLRLQYVEFFPKFYLGGGRPFKALREEHKYITLVDG